MNFKLIKEVIDLVEVFNQPEHRKGYADDLNGFMIWVSNQQQEKTFGLKEISWKGKQSGRSADSEISTLLVHLNRYAKTYSKSAIHDSAFNTQEDFIYLINLQALGEMSKTELIRMNVHEKPVGMQIINRLISQGWVQQLDSKTDRRSKLISITDHGAATLAKSMDKIRTASQVVAGNLCGEEKIQLISLLQKLDEFHEPIYSKNFSASGLLAEAYSHLAASSDKVTQMNVPR